MRFSRLALLVLALSDVAHPQPLRINEDQNNQKSCNYNDTAAESVRDEVQIVNGTAVPVNTTTIEGSVERNFEGEKNSEESDPCDIPQRNPDVPDDPNDFQENRLTRERKLQTQVLNAVIWKVRRCNNWLCFGSSLTKSEFQHWEDANVSNGNQKDTYIGTLREPAKSQTRRLVLLLAGQNGFGNIVGGGIGDMISGSFNDWHQGWSSTTASETHPIRLNSWAYRYFHSFDQGDTFIATSWATSFNWGTSAGEKQDIEDAFYNWLLSKVNTPNLEEVIIAGHNRGGCLALRLAERFNRNFAPQVDVAVMSADPVFNVGQSEFGAGFPQITNPLNNAWEGMSTDMRAEFQKEGRELYVENYVVGDNTFVLNSVKGLSDKRAVGTPFNMGGWYHQDWITWGHTAADDWAVWVGTSPSVFYSDALDWFNGSCPNPCPHGGMYDGAHCYVGSPPAGTTAFVWGGNYYYTPIGANGCPMTGSWYDGANCYVSDAPDDEDPFVWSNNWYYHPNWDDNAMCDAQWSAWYDRDNSSGNGDYELRPLHIPSPCGGQTPLDVQCHTTENGFIDAWSTGEVITCNINGLSCVNAQQPDGYCNKDYKVRYLCP
eukprot:CAMPEP_0185723844 /NCGR_PEP_ID=MMETSP1171-20130828/544_1 /TAXON_ID=374046 /ORGANISM="Helicotheca tamensis, Strain CCMP826" /LENGTH=600 /DNA_ID=CAMNT_0028391599 /DNA_START=126 /DNA_END=1928 /DNA_ORIENTATION=-